MIYKMIYKMILVCLMMFFVGFVSASQKSALDLLMQEQRVVANNIEQAGINKTQLQQKNKIKQQKKHVQPQGKVIHLSHQKINKTNLSQYFKLTRLNASDIALGAVGISSLKQQSDVRVSTLPQVKTVENKK